jgi:hypothetical protein
MATQFPFPLSESEISESLPKMDDPPLEPPLESPAVAKDGEKVLCDPDTGAPFFDLEQNPEAAKSNSNTNLLGNASISNSTSNTNLLGNSTSNTNLLGNSTLSSNTNSNPSNRISQSNALPNAAVPSVVNLASPNLGNQTLLKNSPGPGGLAAKDSAEAKDTSAMSLKEKKRKGYPMVKM